MRKPIIAGNWKLNCNQAEARELARGVLEQCKGVDNVDIVLAPTFTSLNAVAETIRGTNVQLAAQNCYHEEKGAYTGEIGPMMLKEAGCTYCIIGHSERRQYFAETDQGINQKAQALYAAGLLPIICVGEVLEERKADKTKDVVLGQLRGCLNELSRDQVIQTVIAYEPVWAIGTGEVATPDQAQEVHAAIREELKQLYDADLAEAVRIQYGGSVKPDNVKNLMSQPDLDGALVGGASLKADSFSALIRFQEKSPSGGKG